MRNLLINITGIALTCGAALAFMNDHALAGIGLAALAIVIAACIDCGRAVR